MPSPPRRPTSATDASTTATQILDVAERLAQTRGFNGFSYADIATELGITKAGLHYHFAGKADLGCALIERYARTFATALAQIEANERAVYAQLQQYVALYSNVLSDGRMCLCGMLAAEYATLPDAMKRAIRQFFDDNESWLTRVLDKGRDAGTVAFEGKAIDAARVLTAALEGAMLLARSYDDVTRFADAATHVLREFAPPSARRASGLTRSPSIRARRRQVRGRA